MVRVAAFTFGILLAAVGILGFMPEFNHGGRLLSFLAISSMSNLMHLVTGIIAMMCGLKGERASSYFFILVGIIYGAMVLLWLYDSTLALFHYLAEDSINTIFHAIIAALAFSLGLIYFKKHSIPTVKK